PVMQKRLAKYLALKCFRNSVLEDLHSGIVHCVRIKKISKWSHVTVKAILAPFSYWIDMANL
ncbi:MAG: hypothetical protein KJ702_16060, partial [Gammaproteobacteria bacterium]|nr:hypothetical protein [Gammaproteobacteria bacterium]